eukprot:COSAG02_NODE_34604_length_481_cov_1.130890_1_plen_45_part_10
MARDRPAAPSKKGCVPFLESIGAAVAAVRELWGLGQGGPAAAKPQ